MSSSSIPGCSTPEPECTDEVCITCSDEGRVAEVRCRAGRGTGRGAGGRPRRDGRRSLVDDLSAGRPGAGARRRGDGHPRGARRCLTRPVPSPPASSIPSSRPRARRGRPRRGPGRSARAKIDESSSALRAARSNAAATRGGRRGRPWRTASGGAAGSSPSATAGAPPTPKGRAELFRHPPHGRPLPALSLVDDQAVLTALANDVGFELVFSRQIIAHATPRRHRRRLLDQRRLGERAAGLRRGVARGLLTVGLCGYEGRAWP